MTVQREPWDGPTLFLAIGNREMIPGKSAFVPYDAHEVVDFLQSQGLSREHILLTVLVDMALHPNSQWLLDMTWNHGEIVGWAGLSGITVPPGYDIRRDKSPILARLPLNSSNHVVQVLAPEPAYHAAIVRRLLETVAPFPEDTPGFGRIG